MRDYRGHPLVIVFLIAATSGVMGYEYFTSEVRTVQVTGKHIEVGQIRRGFTNVYVLETDQGRMPILTPPIIGYFLGVEDVYEGIRLGSTIQVRVGYPLFGSPSVLAVY